MIFGDTIFRPDTCVSEGRTRRTWVGRRCFARGAREKKLDLFCFRFIFRVFFLEDVCHSVGLSVCRSISLSLCLPLSPSARPRAYVPAGLSVRHTMKRVACLTSVSHA